LDGEEKLDVESCRCDFEVKKNNSFLIRKHNMKPLKTLIIILIIIILSLIIYIKITLPSKIEVPSITTISDIDKD
jgi:hypothetical protein